MTAEIVNLRRARKAKARGDAAATATANRAKFGRGGAERAAQAMGDDLAARRLDGHRLSPAVEARGGDEGG